ncbi:kinase-associated lipoprotein B [Shouchella lonarensis]|uniref:Kinase-associated protein B n=1 Tax=Shouchella lonarensis TaxID=1464122 RepID=A0A1G6HE68_9BACI|nr:kinase-associated lipoprotein B [Shouchella lonarensis]SDB92607.1 kinase-associated protein B [Shouchella lonarensis]
MEKLVQAKYKTGRYIGKLLTIEEENARALIQVLAVLRHPNQGDLHHPKQIDVPLFHQRKALAYLEKTWVPDSTVKPYTEEVPDYAASLQTAWCKQMDDLKKDEDNAWCKQSIAALVLLRKEYKFPHNEGRLD